MREIILDAAGKRVYLRYLTVVIVLLVLASQFLVVLNAKDRFSRTGGPGDHPRSERSIVGVHKSSHNAISASKVSKSISDRKIGVIRIPKIRRSKFLSYINISGPRIMWLNVRSGIAAVFAIFFFSNAICFPTTLKLQYRFGIALNSPPMRFWYCKSTDRVVGPFQQLLFILWD